MIRRPPRSTLSSSSAASDVYKRQNKPYLIWKRAIHPLLSLTFEKSAGRKVVPLDIVLDEKDRILLISGPNAGGKSVCLKTVGLLQYMMQCGLTIPVAEGSETGIFKNILIDIGDEQSIDNDLSTYSSHLINMKYFVKNGNEKTLILIDEFGTGTEPMLGGSIAEAILGELNRKKVYGVITCLLYTSDAADEEDSVDIGGRRIIKKKKIKK